MALHQFTTKQPSLKCYTNGCRCDGCRKIYSDYRRDYWAKDPKKTKAAKENDRRWRQSNKPRLAENQQRFREHNPDFADRYKSSITAASLKYRTSEKGRLKVNFQRSKYVRRHNNAAGNATSEQLKARWNYYGGLCYICGAIATAMDHVIPLKKGGSNWPANLRPACKGCNSQKSDMSLADFLARRAA